MAFHFLTLSTLLFCAAFSVYASGYSSRNPRPFVGSPLRYPDFGAGHDDAPDEDSRDSANNNVDFEWIGPPNSFQNARYVVYPPSDFSYTENGGSRNWPSMFKECGGSHQSPINIPSHYVRNRRMPILKLKHYWDNENSPLLNNTGKRVDVLLEGGRKMPALSGGPLTDEYEFAELHFHWGKNNNEGSEHTINKRAFPMEAHLVHFKKAYGDVEKAAKYSDGFAVVAVFFQVTKRANKNLAELVADLAKVKKAYSTFELPSASTAFEWLEGVTSGPYFTYQGSLTTPPCSEAVLWIVYQHPVSISASQVGAFRSLHTPDGTKIIENHRVTQQQVNPKLDYVL